MLDIDAVVSSRLKYLTIEQAAEVLGVRAGDMSATLAQAKIAAVKYGLPVVIDKCKRVKIPRAEFLRWVKGETTT